MKPKTCQFCGRDIKRGKHCSEFCKDADAAAEVNGDELGEVNQLFDYINLDPRRENNLGYMRIRHIHQ